MMRKNKKSPFIIEGNTLVKYQGADKIIKIPPLITEIGPYCFADNAKIQEVIVPNSCIEIGEFAFLGCKSLTKVVLPYTLKRIEEGAFKNTLKLETITLPYQLTYLGMEAFNNTPELKEIEINRSLKEIYKGTFIDSGLEEVIIDGDDAVIESFSFMRCENLREVTLKGHIQEIKAFAFFENAENFYLNIEGDISKLDAHAFEVHKTIHLNAHNGYYLNLINTIKEKHYAEESQIDE